MSVDIEELDPHDDAADWNRYVERSPDTTPFYRAEALLEQADATDTTLHLLAGFKGQEAVGIFPLFAYRKGPLTAAFSPAPHGWTYYLGPAMCNLGGLKRRKTDRRIERFVEGCLDWLDEELSPLYAKFTTGRFDDVRPFLWNDYDVDLAYTYVVDLDGTEDDLLDRFSSDARNNVRNAPADRFEITVGDADDVEAIVEQVAARYESQGRRFELTPAYARSLYEALPEGSLRPYTCRVDGEFVGGIVVLRSDRACYRWQGGVKPDAAVDFSLNDVLDWHVMRDGLRDGLDRYDLVGAGVPSINRYKAKFDPRLVTHYTVTAGVFGIDLLLDSYQKVV